MELSIAWMNRAVFILVSLVLFLGNPKGSEAILEIIRGDINSPLI